MMTYLEIEARIMTGFARQSALAGTRLSSAFIKELNIMLESADKENYQIAITRLTSEQLIINSEAGIILTENGYAFLLANLNN